MRMLLVLLQKEFRQFRRNSFLPRLMLMFPIVVMLVMPLVTNMEVKHVEVAVVDMDGQSFSRQLIERIEASDYLSLASVGHSYAAALAQIERGEADVIVEIPHDYSRSLTNSYGSAATNVEPKKLNLSGNAVNGTKGSIGLQYVNQMISGTAAALPSARYLYNPTLNYQHFMIPALMIMLLVMITGFIPALGMVSEKEQGTIEQINVTPVNPMIFAIGKVVPYWIMGMIVLTLAMIIAWIVYGLKPEGGIFAVYLSALLFTMVMLSLGVSIAAHSETMQQVMMVMFFFVMVFILMSGLMTPVSSMPIWAQRLTYAIPPRYFVDIMRSVYLRSATISDLSVQFSALAAFALGFTVFAMMSIKKQN